MQISDLPFILTTFPNSQLVKQVELCLFYRWGNRNSSHTQVRFTEAQAKAKPSWVGKLTLNSQ